MVSSCGAARPSRAGSATARAAGAPAGLDDDSRRWLVRLRAPGAERDEAVAELGDLLLRAARFEIRRRGGRGDEAEDLAAHTAHDATIAVLAKLDGFRGASRFTTWAYKFALLEAAAAMRRQAWREREVTLRSEDWALFPDGGSAPPADAETGELLEAVAMAIRGELTPHQRRVLLALTVDGVPIDVLAERLSTTRGALYKTLHDARRKLRRSLDEQGLLPGEVTS
jgi:RNA polymerase sigma-70 factor (ECF subfamily)